MSWDWIDAALPSAKRGTLRIWGQWFGRPYDNLHIPIAYTAFDEGLRFVFNEDEVLTIWKPQFLVLNEAKFEISKAVRVRWEWYWYGGPKTASNLKYLDYAQSVDRAELSSNADYLVSPQMVNISGPAVELV
jgi:hypothetical protein